MQETINRRGFLKIGATLATVPVFSQLSGTYSLFAKEPSDVLKNGEVITGTHWGVLKVTLKDGKVIDSKPFFNTSKIPNSLQGNTADMIYKSRVKYPMVRKSYLENPNDPKPALRGSEEFVRVSYEDAIKLVARELKKTRTQKGPASVFAGSYGWKSVGNVHNSRILLHRFMNLSGGFTGSLGDYSTGASQIIMPHVIGSIGVYEQQTSWPVILEHSNVVVLWGANPISTLKISWQVDDAQAFAYLEKLKASGKKLIIIDPRRSETIHYFDKARWISPLPNTDVAMMLGIANHLYKKGKYDKEFLETYTVGFDRFSEYLLGKTDGIDKTTAWASRICGIDEKTIQELAELFFENRTFMMSGWGMQRAHHGEQPHWMLVTLASMLGQIGLQGGGFSLGHHYSGAGVPTRKGATIGGINAASLGYFDENGKFIGTKSSGNDAASTGESWKLKVSASSFPVARIADALLHPGKTIHHNGKMITYPDIDFIYWVGGNPFSHHQNTNELVKAWKKPRTIVMNSIYWTPSAKMADIVFPATSQYERNDIAMIGDYSKHGISPMKQLVEKQFEAKDDYQIFSDLCLAYAGKELFNAYTENGKKEMDWIEEYYNVAYNTILKTPQLVTDMKPFKVFWSENKPVVFNSSMENESFVKFKDFRDDPILQPLGTPSGMIEIYSDTIAKMNYDDCKAYPSWFEPIEWLGMKQKPAEFHMLSPHPYDRLHSQQNQTRLRDTYAVANHEPIYINPKDAAKKQIKNGDTVRVFNARGEILTGAVVTDDVIEGVICIYEGVWYDPEKPGAVGSICKNGSPNLLTIDIPTSKLANGNISHTALVNIEKYTGKTLPLTAFSAPKGA
ncbi:molybdopterin guanine dinucleotide-containing S/N-oxide reductase [Sulfurospirillum halorespirans]|uniref:TMAO reductase-like protein n=1 Tax=Sulfurospirillum halorespirans DSM 13726 TaxID=1193502 RepID=A0A1D7TJ41_9BACT|nr:molybdopterin guanine dinucleotide-containing S/N-oxide reductase [Sulfurospirillum halorespirans]AOO65035.1 TMAO reductase-like protein [Sulfurospirillum halorespirans DSM 13726]